MASIHSDQQLMFVVFSLNFFFFTSAFTWCEGAHRSMGRVTAEATLISLVLKGNGVTNTSCKFVL